MSKELLETRVSSEHLGKRLDWVLAQEFSDFSRARLQEWLEQGRVKVDGEVITKQRHSVMGGELIELEPLIEDETEVVAQDIELDIIFEDDEILVINKAAGMVVHPGAGNPDETLMNALLHNCPNLRQIPRAGIVHRLDKDTSGVLVVAKTLRAQTSLVEQLQARSVERVYLALVVGRVTSGATINKPIGRHPTNRKKMAVRVGGKEAITHYEVAEIFREHTLLKVSLETGRTHQIRVHMADKGLHLLGDPVYGINLRIPEGMMPEFADLLRDFKRQALHAAQLGFIHPATGEQVVFKTPLPEDISLLVDILRDDEVDYLAQQDEDYDAFDDGDVEVEWVWE